jgi:hypothetical protein
MPLSEDNPVLDQFHTHVLTRNLKYGYCLMNIPGMWIQAWKEQIRRRQEELMNQPVPAE